jgi:RimJ/RimL family protein N-acetyltransferase
MLNGPLLVTERLILRPPAAEDFDDFAEMCADGETMKFLGGATERPQAWRLWCTLAGAWHIRGFSMFSVIERDSGAWVGRIGPWYPADWPGPEIAYGVRRDYAGKGYAYEAAVAACDFAIEFLKWDQLMHCIDPDNIRSQALAKRLGATNSGPTKLPAPFHDAPIDAWTQSADTWRARRKEM